MAHNIGTLIVVILKARNLPNKRQFGKQDPYCVVVLNGENRKTKVIKRGGQHPEWDEEIRFTIYEDSDVLNTSDNGTPPPLPPKAGDGPKKIRGGEKMALACFAADREPELIGETMVDLTEVLTKGETDEWFTLLNKDKYSGEVYLELTFWSNEPRPKKSIPNLAKVNKQYGGPGVFVPSEESPGHRQQGSGSSHDGYRRDSIPSSILPSNSSMGLDLYKPDYEQTVRVRGHHGASVEQLVNDLGELVVADPRGRDTYPPMQSSFPARSVSTSGHSASSSSSSLAFPLLEGPVHDPSAPGSTHRAVTPMGQRPHRYSLASSQPHEIPQYQPSYEPSPPSSRTSYHAPSRHGPRYSMPAASSGFIPVSATFESALHATRSLASYGSEPGLAPPPTNASLTVARYTPSPSHTPAPTGFTSGPSVSPAPTLSTASTSTGSFLSTNPQQQSQALYASQARYNPPVSAPPSQLPTSSLPMFPTPPQSAPPQVHPALTQPVSGQPHEYMSSSVPVPQHTTRVVSNHIPGSRPLPPEPQQATQRVSPSPSALIPTNQAYARAIGALPLPYGQNQVPPPNSDPGLPPVQQNPLPVPPGPPGPLGPGAHTPSKSTNSIVSAGSPYHYTPNPSPQPSPSQRSPNLRMSDGMTQSSGSLPPSPVPLRIGHPRSISGRPSLPLPTPPSLPATGSYPQLPLPQLPIPPQLISSSESQQRYLTSSTSAVMQEGQLFYPGPPPRPPTQISDSFQHTSHRQVAH